MDHNLTAVSLFSGCGGFDWGATQAGVKIIWANDIDEHAACAYQSVFPHVDFALGDIQSIQEFPSADILIGCYPCTGFSIGARRRSADMESRNLKANQGNYLYREFIRALRQVQPKYIFVENVVGMLTAEKGWFLEQQLRGFRRHGYRVRFERLNAIDYGVAQSRERIFIVGVRKDETNLAYLFPQPTHSLNAEDQRIRVLQDVISDMPEWPTGEFFEAPFHGHYLTRNRKRAWDKPSYTIVAHASHVPLHPLGKPMKHVGKDAWELQGKRNRRLSWRECAAIQGLPEAAIPSGTLKQKYRVVGNAVPPLFGYSLLKPVVEFELSKLRDNIS